MKNERGDIIVTGNAGLDNFSVIEDRMNTIQAGMLVMVALALVVLFIIVKAGR